MGWDKGDGIDRSFRSITKFHEHFFDTDNIRCFIMCGLMSSLLLESGAPY